MSVLESYMSLSSERQRTGADIDSSKLDSIDAQMNAAIRELFPEAFADEDQAKPEAPQVDTQSTPTTTLTEADEPNDTPVDNETVSSDIDDETAEQDKRQGRLTRLKKALVKTAITKPRKRIAEAKRKANERAKADKENDSRRRRIFRGIGSVATATAAAGLIFAYSTTTGDANGAEYTMIPSSTSLDSTSTGTDIMIGGRLDGTSQGVDAMYGDVLRDNPDKILINYPAGIAPLDSTSWNDSVNIGASNTVSEALNTGHPNDVHLFGHSQGSTVAVEAANRLNDMGYDPELTITGSPETGVSGFFHGPLAQSAAPLLESVGVDATPRPLPEGTTVYGKPGDFWANSGGRPVQTQVGQALGTFLGDTHAYSPEDLTNPANTSFVGEDGVNYVTVHDELSGYGNAATAHGFEWSPQAEAFVDSIAPEGEIGKPAPAPDLNKAIQTGTNLAVDSINRALPPEIPRLAEVPVYDTPPAPAPAPVTPPAPVYIPEAAPAPMPAPAPIPAPVDLAPQVSNTINDVANQVQSVVGHNTPEAQVVNDIAAQAHNLVNNFLPR